MEPNARPLRDRKMIWLASIAGAVLILVVYLIVPPAHQNSSVLLTVVGGLGALAFYLRHRAEIDRYLAAQDARWEQLREDSEATHGPLLNRLRARRGTGPNAEETA